MFSNVFRRKFNHGICLKTLLHPDEDIKGDEDRRPQEPPIPVVVVGEFCLVRNRPRTARRRREAEPVGSA